VCCSHLPIRLSHCGCLRMLINITEFSQSCTPASEKRVDYKEPYHKIKSDDDFVNILVYFIYAFNHQRLIQYWIECLYFLSLEMLIVIYLLISLAHIFQYCINYIPNQYCAQYPYKSLSESWKSMKSIPVEARYFQIKILKDLLRHRIILVFILYTHTSGFRNI
jgi:flagellar biosynthesis protein FlhB